jgi:thiaminase/transcriptional activator TenA
MGFSNRLIEDKRVKEFYKRYMDHPFIKGLGDGTLEKERYKKYLIQDTLYLKDYAKVYAHAFLLGESVSELQFLHSCIGIVMSEETNMHIRYLKDFNLDVYKIDGMEYEKENRDYLDYMLSFKDDLDMKTLFVSALPCTLAYEYIGKSLKNEREGKTNYNYYDPWINAYAGKEFEAFSKESCELIDRHCKEITKEEEEKLIQVFLRACEFELRFWDMSFAI